MVDRAGRRPSPSSPCRPRGVPPPFFGALALGAAFSFVSAIVTGSSESAGPTSRRSAPPCRPRRSAGGPGSARRSSDRSASPSSDGSAPRARRCPPSAVWVARWCRLTMLMPSTVTRPVLGKTWSTVPRFPFSSPEITCTVSPLVTCSRMPGGRLMAHPLGLLVDERLHARTPPAPARRSSCTSSRAARARPARRCGWRAARPRR